MRDERYFGDAETFNPDRYLAGNNKNYKFGVDALRQFSPDDPSSLVFGFGRRYATYLF